MARSPGEAAHRCQNLSCPAQLKGQIRHFASRNAMDIQGLGDKLVDQLVEEKLVKNIADLYFIKSEQWSKLERMADKSAQNIMEALEKSKHINLGRFIFALGIRFIGEHAAQLLANHYKSFANLRNTSLEELLNIHEIGPQSAQSIIQFFAEPKNLKTVDRLMNAGIIIEHEQQTADQKLVDKTFVFTGTLQSFSRKQAEEFVISRGGRAASSVSKKTDYVVVGKDPGSKAAKAHELGITILSEEDFNKMVR